MKNWLAILGIVMCASLTAGKGYFPEPAPEESIIPEEDDGIVLDLDEDFDEDTDNPDE